MTPAGCAVFSAFPAETRSIRIPNNPMLIALDNRNEYGEDRWIGIGLLKNVVAVVVYIEREHEEAIRILSARRATRWEGKAYHKRIAD